MGVIVPVGEYTATFVFDLSGTTRTPTWGFGFQYVGPDPEPSEAALAQTIYNTVTGATASPFDMYSAARLSNAWGFLGVSVMRQTVDGPIVGEFFDRVQGLSVEGPLPVNCTWLVTKRTARGGRKYRGRCYPPANNLGEVGVGAAGDIGPENVATLQGYFDRMFDELESHFISPVLHHSTEEPGTQITSFAVGTTIATQRRRMRS